MSDTFNHEADAWDSLLFGNRHDELEDFGMHSKQCRWCGATGLMWGKVGSNWRLFDPTSGVHVCYPNFRVKIKNHAT